MSSLLAGEIQYSVGRGDAAIRSALHFVNAIETTLESVSGDELKAKGADPKSFLDESLAREVEASGFNKSLYEN